jgi:hypothetical protein
MPPRLLEILNKLRELYPDEEITFFIRETHSTGKLLVNGRFILQFNCTMLDKQLSENGPEFLIDTVKYFADVMVRKYLSRKNQFVKHRGRKAANPTETQIRYAVANSKSNLGAARLLGMHINTYKKYAHAYGLYENHNNKIGLGITKGGTQLATPLSEIYANKHLKYSTTKLKRRMVEAQDIEEKCEICGYHDHRTIDNQTALLLDWKDGNQRNFARENLRLICYNCTFNVRGRLNVRQVKFSEKVYEERMQRPDLGNPEKYDELFDRFNPKK